MEEKDHGSFEEAGVFLAKLDAFLQLATPDDKDRGSSHRIQQVQDEEHPASSSAASVSRKAKGKGKSGLASQPPSLEEHFKGLAKIVSTLGL